MPDSFSNVRLKDGEDGKEDGGCEDAAHILGGLRSGTSEAANGTVTLFQGKSHIAGIAYFWLLTFKLLIGGSEGNDEVTDSRIADRCLENLSRPERGVEEAAEVLTCVGNEEVKAALLRIGFQPRRDTLLHLLAYHRCRCVCGTVATTCPSGRRASTTLRFQFVALHLSRSGQKDTALADCRLPDLGSVESWKRTCKSDSPS